jgi:hypothetical protein
LPEGTEKRGTPPPPSLKDKQVLDGKGAALARRMVAFVARQLPNLSVLTAAQANHDPKSHLFWIGKCVMESRRRGAGRALLLCLASCHGEMQVLFLFLLRGHASWKRA